jgi:hypothetical protein
MLPVGDSWHDVGVNVGQDVGQALGLLGGGFGQPRSQVAWLDGGAHWQGGQALLVVGNEVFGQPPTCHRLQGAAPAHVLALPDNPDPSAAMITCTASKRG